MNRVRALAGLVFLAVLTAGAPPQREPERGGPLLVQIAGVRAPERPDSGLLLRESPNEVLRNASSKGIDGFSGGPTGTFLIVAGLVAAAALILAVVVPW